MKLLSVYLARAAWLGNQKDFNPRGMKLTTTVTPYLLDTYKFKDYPKPNDPYDDTKGTVFGRGEFVNPDGNLIEVRLSLFSFAVIAETASSTSDSDYFLETLLTQLHDTFNLIHYTNVIRKKDYLSQVYVSTEKVLAVINPKLKMISDYLNNNIIVHGEVDYEVSSIEFWANPIKQINPLPFVFARQAASPFAENRYFSSAPLQTEKHLELLEMLENVLS